MVQWKTVKAVLFVDGGLWLSSCSADTEQSMNKETIPIQDHVIDRSTVKVGDKITGLTVSEVTHEMQGISHENAISIKFAGSTTFSGTFIYYKQNEYFTNKIVISPKGESIFKIPILKEVNQKSAGRLLHPTTPLERVKELLQQILQSGWQHFE